MRSAPSHHQRGASLIAALFVIVVLGTLGLLNGFTVDVLCLAEHDHGVDGTLRRIRHADIRLTHPPGASARLFFSPPRRRNFALHGAFALYPLHSVDAAGEPVMAFTLSPLPFPKDSLDPTMSARTLEHHHDKHHAAYVTKLNELIAGTPHEKSDLETIISATAKATADKDKKIFNNAAQVWNHDFFWESLAPNGGGTPPEPLLKRLNSTFGSFENFRDKFVDAAVNQFGSGWAWLVSKGGKLDILATPDADNPLTHDAQALWTCDVWEHAYYLDYQQERAQFVKAVVESVANWQFVGKRLVESDR